MQDCDHRVSNFDSRFQVPLPLRDRPRARIAQREIIAHPLACLRPLCVRRAPSVVKVPFCPLLVHLGISVLMERRSRCRVRLASSLTSHPPTFANHVQPACIAPMFPWYKLCPRAQRRQCHLMLSTRASAYWVSRIDIVLDANQLLSTYIIGACRQLAHFPLIKRSLSCGVRRRTCWVRTLSCMDLTSIG
jgi:hypothetical protein